MPLELLNDDGKFAWGTWKITEDEKSIQTLLLSEQIPDSITNEKKRLEYIAARALLQQLLRNWGLDYLGLTKDRFGKPFCVAHPLEISLSHSFPYVAAVIARTKSVGIDLEQPKPKLLSIAKRVLSQSELNDAGVDVIKHCIIWCAKESMVKVHGKKDLEFAKHLLIEPFQKQQMGSLIGRIVATHTTTVPLHYRVYDNFVIVVTNW